MGKAGRRPMEGRNRDVVARIAAGEKYESIAILYGITRQRVEQIARRAGVRSNRSWRNPAMAEGRRAVDAARAAARERIAAARAAWKARMGAALAAVRAGRSQTEVSAEFRIRYRALSFQCSRAGVSSPRTGGWVYTAEQKAAALARVAAGEDMDEVAWATGVSYPTLRVLLRGRGGKQGQDGGPVPRPGAAIKT